MISNHPPKAMTVPSFATALASHVRRIVLPFVLVFAAMATAQAYTFNSTSDVPITAASYDATGQSIDLSLNFAPPAGANLTVIRNTGTGFITGNFNNLANGATVKLTYGGNTYSFVAWYYGGDGNDLVLLWPYTGLAAWGGNFGGALGDNTYTDRLAPVAVDQSGVLRGKTIVQVMRGNQHALALTSEGKVYAWGHNLDGQLGDNTTTDRLTPVAVDTSASSALFGKAVIAIAAGSSHSLALCSDGTLAAWGFNAQGELGDNSNTDRYVPVAVNTASGVSALFGKAVVKISGQDLHSLALCSDGTVAAWGYNGYGQLGDNTTTNRSAPVAVIADSGVSALFGKTVTAITGGTFHSLALCSDGTVVAWGRNSNGVLGDNTTTDRPLPVAVNTDSGTSALFGKTVTAIAGNTTHNLALCSDGTVVAWGYNGGGALGDNTTTTRLAPVAVNTASGTSALSGKTVTAIAVGDPFSLALRSDGVAVAWGQTVGDNTTQQRNAPVIVNTTSGVSVLAGHNVSALSGGGNFCSFSVLIDGLNPPEIAVEQPSGTNLTDGVSTIDYGSTTFGSSTAKTVTIRNTGEWPLSIGTISVDGANSGEFLLNSAGITSSLSGGSSTAFTVTCFPASLGAKTAALHIVNGDANEDENPFDVALAANVITPAATFNSAGDVPITATSYDATGQSIDLTLNFAPATGTNLTVIRNTGTAFITGNFSNLANGATVKLTYGGTTYPFIAWYYGGDGNDLVLLWPYTGLAAWGANFGGALGDNTYTDRLAPVAVDQTGVLRGKTIVQVTRGNQHTLALTSEGKVYAWGHNFDGQLGDNTTTDRLTPVAVDTSASSALFGKMVIAIAAGSMHSLALCSDGTLAAWGFNAQGELGDNSTTDRYVPVAVNTASGVSALFGKAVVKISGQDLDSLALCSDGTVVGWGYNGFGQLGDNTTTNRSAPVAVIADSGVSALFGKTVTAISGGTFHSLALCSDGTVVAWGRNSSGVLGDNTTTDRPLPVAVNTDSGTSALYNKTVTAIAGSTTHNLALCSDGTVVAWGSNAGGCLGDNTTTTRLAPVAVNTASGTSALFGKTVTAIAVSDIFSLALRSDGVLAAWGQAVGDNTNQQRNAPVVVSTTGGISVLAGHSVTGLSGGGAFCSFSAVIYALTPPEIGIEQPSGTNLTDGVSTIDYGPVAVGNSAARTVTIRNTGEWPLAIGAISVDGADPSQFIVDTTGTASSVDGGGFTTFTITCSPTSVGVKTAALHIVNNDGNDDENPFDIALSGGNSAPVLSLPSSSVIAEATSSAGAVVTFSVTASDLEDGTLTPSVTPASGNVFAIGDTTVLVSATDSGGVTTSDSFVVHVQDTIAPQVVAPANVTVNATSTAGAVVSYSPASTSDAVGVTSVTYSQESGTTFPVGTTTVAITAQDHANNTGAASFTVTVEPGALDKKAPTVAITAPTTASVAGTFTISGTVKDDFLLASLTVKLNGETQTAPSFTFVSNTTVPWSLSGLAPQNGLNVIEVEARDFAGHITRATKTVSYVNNRPELAGTYSALLVPGGTPGVDTSGLVTVTVTATGTFTGKAFLSGARVPVSGYLSNEGVARFKPALGSSFDLIDKTEFDSYLGALSFKITGAGMCGTLSTQQDGGSVLANFTGSIAVTAATPGIYNIAFPAKAQTPSLASSLYPQGDGFARVIVNGTGSVSAIGYLADGTLYSAASKLRTDGSSALFAQLYRKAGGMAGELTFASLDDSDASGTNFLWIRPTNNRARYYPAGWPAGIKVDAVGTKYANPASLDFGQGGADATNGNSSLVFADGLLTGTVRYSVSVDPSTGAVKLVPGTPAAFKFKISAGTGQFTGAFLHTDTTADSFRGILLNKGANQGGFGYFLSTPPLTYGGSGQGGGVSLEH